MNFPFLTARWRDLVVVNFEVDPEILQPFLPRGTELDLYEGRAFISLVAFRFNRCRLLGLIPSLPTYSFEEINLRFYVKREGRRAVAFVKEVVPSRVIAGSARLLYQEPYLALRTSSSKSVKDGAIEYRYRWGNELECEVCVEAGEIFEELGAGTFEEFILEHYWGFTAQADASTVEYRVAHPRWRVSKAVKTELSQQGRSFYGAKFERALSGNPHSTFVAEGSAVSVSFPRRFFHPLPVVKPRGWVLYDGSCGFCAWWIPVWRKTITNSGYDVAPLQSEWVQKKLNLSAEELSRDIRLLLSDDTLISGADAYIYGMKQVWWSWPIGWLLGLPLLRQLTWKAYRIFNRNRFLVSKVCGLKPVE